MNNLVKITKDDIKPTILFIIALVKNLKTSTMGETLTSKSDYIGGIFDRYINRISETLLFDKIIFPKIKSNHNIKSITDYYLYVPGKNKAGIAPDLIGIKIDNKSIPFAIFDEKWKPLDKMPQVEIKTFKKKDQMVSLRNQNYDNEYLILADLYIRIDYLLPFFADDILSNKLIESLKMNDDIFIKSDKKIY